MCSSQSVALNGHFFPALIQFFEEKLFRFLFFHSFLPVKSCENDIVWDICDKSRFEYFQWDENENGYNRCQRKLFNIIFGSFQRRVFCVFGRLQHVKLIPQLSYLSSQSKPHKARKLILIFRLVLVASLRFLCTFPAAFEKLEHKARKR